MLTSRAMLIGVTLRGSAIGWERQSSDEQRRRSRASLFEGRWCGSCKGNCRRSGKPSEGAQDVVYHYVLAEYGKGCSGKERADLAGREVFQLWWDYSGDGRVERAKIDLNGGGGGRDGRMMVGRQGGKEATKATGQGLDAWKEGGWGCFPRMLLPALDCCFTSSMAPAHPHTHLGLLRRLCRLGA